MSFPDLGAITPQVWFDVHQGILSADDNDSESPKSREPSPIRCSPQHTLQTVSETPQCQPLEDIIQRRRLNLPSFNSVFSPL